MKKITVPFFISHQGCPHSCSFCDQSIINGNSGLLPSKNEIISKIEQWRQSSSGRPLEIAFFGGSFTALSKEHQLSLLEPLQPLIKSKIIENIRISTRPDYIDNEILETLVSLGVTTVEIGVQSTDDYVLYLSGRGHNPQDSLKALALIKSHNIYAGAQLMPGLPGDSLEKSRHSLAQVVAAGADFVRIYPVVVLANTALAAEFLAGKYNPLAVSEAVNWCKIMLHDSLLANIPVIRIGLQADQGLNQKNILGGSWHPALGQLVGSALYGDLIENLLSKVENSPKASIFCNPSRLSDCIGHNRQHFIRFGERISTITADNNLKKDEVAIQQLNQYIKESIVTGLNY